MDLEENAFRNLAAGRHQRVRRQAVLSAVASVALIALALSASITCVPAWGQVSEPSVSGGSRPTVQTGLDGVQRAQEAPATKIKRRSGVEGPQKAVANTVKNDDNQTPFGALNTTNRGPINIQSDSLALDYKRNEVLFSGHVHATQADGALTSNTLDVKYGKDFHQVQNMAATGNVRISQGVRWCTSDRAVMNQPQHTVVLSGSPVCHDASDQITGTRITVHLDTGKSDVEGAKAVIFPQTPKTRDNEAVAAEAK